MHGMLTRDVMRFAAVVAAGAFMILTHWSVARRLFADPMIGRPMRWLALLPPFTPFVAFYEGKRTASYSWLFALGVYLFIRTSFQ